MTQERLSMSDIREILRLKFTTSLKHREIGDSCGKSASTVAECVARFKAAGLSWPLPEEMDDTTLQRRLYRSGSDLMPSDRAIPDWAWVHRELRRKGVTLLLLWQEYRQEHPDGFQYSWFCEHYEAYRCRLDPTMRQTYSFGEKSMVDYAGPTVPVVDPLTGEVREAQIFVGVLAASNYTFAEATWSQQLPFWIGSHVRMFEYFGGVTALAIPDNLRSGVTRADRYEPVINPTYRELAQHYGLAIMPTRSWRPRDKAKVENAVLVVERWILARLRHRTFTSLEELNTAIRSLLADLNDRPFKKMPGSRRSIYEAYERPALRPLPATPFVFGAWTKARVNIDYHCEVDGHYYSAPYTLIHEYVRVRVTAFTVELFHDNRRVASHARSSRKGHHTTLAEHMPPKHRKYLEWTPERLESWAQKTGPFTAQMVVAIMASKPHPQQGYRACLGVLRLSHKYGVERVEAACQRGMLLGACSYQHVKSILEKGLDRQPLPPPAVSGRAPLVHENLRGREYYN